ncbi:unnamed protein product [Paramecium sonneborni]|uniref:Uncharacterized protein n=1 Tax=Paramecium sonneborni TaxID=65129 RepID=A0A8S1PZT7_9CILI|nr:unnamed protein product [Paramecium sonneborni]
MRQNDQLLNITEILSKVSKLQRQLILKQEQLEELKKLVIRNHFLTNNKRNNQKFQNLLKYLNGYDLLIIQLESQ